MKSLESRKLKSLLILHGIDRKVISEKAAVSLTFVSYVVNGQRKSGRVKRIIEEMIREKSGKAPKA